jgi:multicomponent Na+:H+ antiporter subunit C
LANGYSVYSNPLPHVLILTAIVVGVATLALGLALVVRIREAYGSIEEDEVLAEDQANTSTTGHA